MTRIVDVLYFRDGGTVGVILEDEKKKRTSFCFDRRLGSETPNRIYVGATHPENKGAKLVEKGSSLEETILFGLRKALDVKHSPSEQKKLLRKESAADLQGEETKIWWILKALEQYEAK